MHSLKEINTNTNYFNLLVQSIPVLMVIFLFFSPMPHTTAIKEICFYLSIFIVLFLVCFKKIDFTFQSPLALPFLLFVIWVFIGLFFSLDKGNSIHDFRAHLLKYLAYYFLLVNFFNSRKRLIILTWTVIISAGVFAFGAITYYYIILGHNVSGRFVLFIYKDYIYVFALLLSISHLLNNTKLYSKAVLLICILGTGTTMLLTQTRSALLALVLSLIFLLNKYKKLLIVFAVIILVGVEIVPGYNNRFTTTQILNNERIGMNLTSLEIIKSYPVTGIGFGMETYGNKNFVDLQRYNAKIPPKYQQGTCVAAPHNMLFDVTVRTGLVGLALFLYILFVFVRMGWKVIRHGRDDFIRHWGTCIMASFIALLTQSMFSDATFGLQAIVFYTILAMMTIIWKLNLESNPQILQDQ